MNLERLVEYILNDFWEDIFEKEPEELNKPCARVLVGKLCGRRQSNFYTCMYGFIFRISVVYPKTCQE